MKFTLRSVIAIAITVLSATALSSCGTANKKFNAFQDEPRNETERQFQRAVKSKNTTEKIECFENAIKNAEQSKDEFILGNSVAELGTLYFKAGKYELAEPLMVQQAKLRDEALLANPFENPSPSYPLLLPLIYEKQKNYDKAEQTFLSFLKTDETHGHGDGLSHDDVTEALIDFYMRHEDWRKAHSLLVKSIRIMPNVLDARQVHKISTCGVKLHETAPALDFIRRSIALVPDSAPTEVAESAAPSEAATTEENGSIQGNRNAEKLERQKLQSMAETEKYYLAPLYADLGDCLKEANDVKGAETAYKKALILQPGLTQAENGLSSKTAPDSGVTKSMR
jgi:tetratricopeptide (TPR) repeat protein